MEFIPAVRKCLQDFAKFEGRAGRPEYWWFALFYLICLVIATILDELLGGYSIIDTLVILALLLPSLAVSARRLHDTDRSAWWLLLGLIPVVGAIALFVFYAMPGTPGPNRFGAGPLGTAVASAPGSSPTGTNL